MLMPKRVKYRKQMRGRMKGKAQRGSDIHYGDYGLQALDTKRAAESRMGKGKGAVEFWAAVVKPGRIMFEVGGGVPEDVAKHALKLASYKLSVKTRIITGDSVVGE
jgi:large subunit ribosomal protein L16